jgi:hypothetical protein
MSEHETQGTGDTQQPSQAPQYPPPQGTPVPTRESAAEDPTLVQAPPSPSAAPPQPQPQTPPQPARPPGAPQYVPPASAPPAAAPQQSSLVDRAKAGDSEALATMFAQFLPKGEQVIEGQYLGVLGFWGIGTHSFAAVTPRRFATLRISLLGGVAYSDGSLEYVNSAAVFQPSKVMLYVTATVVSLFFFLAGVLNGIVAGIVLLLISLALLPITIRIYYRFNKSGIVLWVREGLQVYAFIDRSRMRVANQLYRRCTDAREERLRMLGHP